MLGTHNSCTGYPVINWWLKPFNVFSKCQDTTLEKQVSDGVEVFNIQVAKHPDGNWYASHGLMWYDITIEEICRILRGKYVQLYYDHHFGINKNNVEWNLLIDRVQKSDVNLVSTWNEGIDEKPNHLMNINCYEKYWTMSWAKQQMETKGKFLGIIPRFWYMIPLPKYWSKKLNTGDAYMKDFYTIY